MDVVVRRACHVVNWSATRFAARMNPRSLAGAHGAECRALLLACKFVNMRFDSRLCRLNGSAPCGALKLMRSTTAASAYIASTVRAHTRLSNPTLRHNQPPASRHIPRPCDMPTAPTACAQAFNPSTRAPALTSTGMRSSGAAMLTRAPPACVAPVSGSTQVSPAGR